MKIELTRAECEAAAEFIGENILDVIREDVDLDNIAWVRNMLNVQKKLEEAGEATDEDE